jgi:hypothetical protein
MPGRAVAVIGSLAVATAMVGTGIGIGIGMAGATGTATTRTLHFSEQLSPSETVSKGHFVTEGTLTHRKLAKSGKPAGYVTYACEPTSSKTVLRCNAAFTLAGGIVLTRLNLNFAASTSRGVVTGGDWIYGGVRGTLTEQTEDTGITIVDLKITTK